MAEVMECKVNMALRVRDIEIVQPFEVEIDAMRNDPETWDVYVTVAGYGKEHITFCADVFGDPDYHEVFLAAQRVVDRYVREYVRAHISEGG